MASATSLAAWVAACGGGSSSTGSPPAPAPAPAQAASQPIAPQMSVPDPTGYDANHLAAFNRLNEIRLSAGLGMLAQNAEMDEAAQAHADWMVLNDDFSHVETAGTPGFAGANWWDRDAADGYKVYAGSEIMEAGSDPASAVDALANVIYHRTGMLQVDIVDVGVGFNSGMVQSWPRATVIDMSVPFDRSARNMGQSSQSYLGGTVIWPLNGATDVSTAMGNETPNPVPTQSVLTLGTPASLQVSMYENLSTSRFQMFDDSTGGMIPTSLLNEDSDQNHEFGRSEVAIIPVSRLAFDTKYRVEFVGSSHSTLTSSTRQIALTWWFTTGSNVYPPNRIPSAAPERTVVPRVASAKRSRD